MLYIELPMTENSDNLPYTFACCSKIIRDIKLKYGLLFVKALPRSTIFYIFL